MFYIVIFVLNVFIRHYFISFVTFSIFKIIALPFSSIVEATSNLQEISSVLDRPLV
jgi:hypothetical protein